MAANSNEYLHANGLFEIGMSFSIQSTRAEKERSEKQATATTENEERDTSSCSRMKTKPHKHIEIFSTRFVRSRCADQNGISVKCNCS